MSDILRRKCGSSIGEKGFHGFGVGETGKKDVMGIWEGDWSLNTLGGLRGLVGVLGRLVSPLLRLRSFSDGEKDGIGSGSRTTSSCRRSAIRLVYDNRRTYYYSSDQLVVDEPENDHFSLRERRDELQA